MSDLRDQLEREGARVSLAPGSATRLWDRRRRNERRRRVSALVVGLSITLAVVVLSLQGALIVGDGEPPPPGGTAGTYEEIAGTYTTRLTSADATVARLGVEGPYELRLLPSGVLLLSVPPGFDQAVGSVVFRLSGNVFTTNAFTNYLCPGTVGTYRWALDAETLRFVPLGEPCEIRAAVLSTRPWRIASGA
jgi:hypothetical protein